MLEFHVKGMEKVAASFGKPEIVEHFNGSNYESRTVVNFKYTKEQHGFSFEYDIKAEVTSFVKQRNVLSEDDPVIGVPRVVDVFTGYDHFKPEPHIKSLKFSVVIWKMKDISIEVNRRQNLDQCGILRGLITENLKKDVHRFKLQGFEIASNATMTRITWNIGKNTDLYTKSLIFNSLLLTAVAHFMNVDRPAGFELVPKPRPISPFRASGRDEEEQGQAGDGAGAV
jgi:hypothetical protein